MAELPQPEVPLTGSCSVVFDNVLYTYSGSAFQSLALEEGAEWETLPGGVSVDGGACVGSTPGDPSVAGFFIVGGSSASPDWTGVQKYTYSSGKWETIPLTDPVIKDRINHSATFLTASDSILVYAGDQGGSEAPSSQTFTIQVSAPHSVQAYQSTISPPGVAPVLLPWSATQAVLVGGNPTNLNVMLFDPANSWVDSGTTLAEPLSNDGSPKAALITGDDGSKHLYTFDLSAAPNQVKRIVLAGAGGAPVPASAPITARQLVDSWPAYNSTLAPTTIRNGFSVASDSSGTIAISGGNDEDPLTIFNGKENQWVDATNLLVPEQAVFSAEAVSSSSATSSATSSGTSSTASSATSSATSSVTSSATSSVLPSSSSTASISSSIAPSTSGATNAAETASSSTEVSPESDQGMPPTTILGIVLGLIFGIALILVLLLFCIKKARKRQDAARAASAQGPNGFSDEKGPIRDLPQGPSPFLRGHQQQGSAGSFSSMAILMGKAQKPGLQRKASNDTKRSSVSSIFNKEFKSTIGRPQYKESPEPDFLPRTEKNIPTTTTANIPRRPARASVNPDGTMRRSSGWNRYWSGGSLNVLGLGSGNNTQRQTIASETSHYSDTNRLTQDSATVPPLQVETRFELNRVNSGSPTISQYNPHIREGQSGQIERPVSATSSSGYSSGIPESVHDTWDPNMAKQPWGSKRAPSSAYSQSTVNFVNGIGASNTSRPPTGVSRLPQLETAAISSDMSWLNLGESKPSQR